MYNTLKTSLLLVLPAAILMLIGGAVGGRGGLLIALILAPGMNVASSWYSDRIVLGLYGAREVSEAEALQLYSIMRRLARIKNRDTLTMTVTATIASAVMVLAQMAQWTAFFGGFSTDNSLSLHRLG